MPLLDKGAKAIEELEKLKATTQPGGSEALKALEGYVKKEDVTKLLGDTVRRSEETGLALLTQMSSLVSQHLHTYKEPLDAPGLINHARSKNMSLTDAYADFTAEKREKLEVERKKDERKKLEEEIRSQLRSEMGHGVYPVGPGEDATSPTLAGLTAQKSKTGGDEQFGVKAALDAYYAMNKS
jgi:hypothetical protein